MAGDKGGPYGIIAGVVGALVFLLLFFLLELGLLVSLGAAVLSWVGALLVARPPAKEARFSLEGPAKEDYDRVLRAADDRLKEISAAGSRAKGRGRVSIDLLVAAVGGVIADVRKDPRDFRDARRFLESYLESATKIVLNYDEISSRGIQGGEIATSLAKSEEALATVAAAFEKLRSRLVESDTMDLGAEIDALERSLDAEGLTK